MLGFRNYSGIIHLPFFHNTWTGNPWKFHLDHQGFLVWWWRPINQPTGGHNKIIPGICQWEYPHKIWPYIYIWYSTSILGSWNSHWIWVYPIIDPNWRWLPSGKRLRNYGKCPCLLMGKSTISTGPFSIANCWHNQRVSWHWVSLITWYPGLIGSNLKTGDHRLECLFLVVYI